MKVEIKTEEDENFKIVDPENVDKPLEVEPEEPSPIRVKKPAPLHNNRGVGWFDGTSWGTK